MTINEFDFLGILLYMIIMSNNTICTILSMPFDKIEACASPLQGKTKKPQIKASFSLLSHDFKVHYVIIVK